MISKQLELLWDEARQAHQRLQDAFSAMDPVIGLSQHMRKQGIPADVVLIDHARSGKRIILVLHDSQPEIVSYQLAWIEQDPENEFMNIKLKEVNADTLFNWMVEYFHQE